MFPDIHVHQNSMFFYDAKFMLDSAMLSFFSLSVWLFASSLSPLSEDFAWDNMKEYFMETAIKDSFLDEDGEDDG